MLVAITAGFVLPDLPHNTRGFTAEELDIAQLRMIEDVGEKDEDADGQGTFGGLFMALKDYKMYLMSLTFTAYVVGLSFNAFFVSSMWPLTRNYIYLIQNMLTIFKAYSHQDTRLQLRANSAHERSSMGLLMYRVFVCCPPLR